MAPSAAAGAVCGRDHLPLFLYRDIIQLLSLHHTDRLNSDTSAADNFDMFELFFDKLDDRVIFGCGLDEFQKEAVFSIVDDTCLKVSAIWKSSALSSGEQSFTLM